MPIKGYHACRLVDPAKFKKDSFRTKDEETEEGKTLRLILGKLKGEDDMTLQAYRYPTKDWTEPEADSHCDDHDGILFEPAADEDDSDRGGRTDMDNDETKATEAAPDATPTETRAGAVLNRQNREALEAAESDCDNVKVRIRKVLDSAKKGEDTDENAATFPAEFRAPTATPKLPKGVETRMAAEMRLVEEEGEPSKIVGIAVRFDTWTDMGWFKEIVRKGAFAKTIKEKTNARDDIRGLFNHDPNWLLARTNNGTLKVWEDDIGLRYEITLPDTTAGRDVYTLIKDRLVTQSSYAFRPTRMGQKTTYFGEYPDEEIQRELTELILFDTSPVTYGAQPETEAEVARAAFRAAGLDLDTLVPQLLRRQAGLPINPDSLRSSLSALRSLLPEGAEHGCGRCKAKVDRDASPDSSTIDNPSATDTSPATEDPVVPADSAPPSPTTLSPAAEPVLDHSADDTAPATLVDQPSSRRKREIEIAEAEMAI